MERRTLTISTGGRNYSVQGYANDIDNLFNSLVQYTLNPGAYIPSTPTAVENHTETTSAAEQDDSKADAPTTEIAVEEHSEENGVTEVAPEESDDGNNEPEKEGPFVTPRSYRGFLMIECQGCHKVRGFNAKEEQDSYRCNECGTVTPFTDIIPLTAICECGKRWRYMTNLKSPSYEIDCISCGSPIPVFYNDKKQKYETLLDGSEPKHTKKAAKKPKLMKKGDKITNAI